MPRSKEQIQKDVVSRMEKMKSAELGVKGPQGYRDLAMRIVEKEGLDKPSWYSPRGRMALGCFFAEN